MTDTRNNRIINSIEDIKGKYIWCWDYWTEPMETDENSGIDYWPIIIKPIDDLYCDIHLIELYPYLEPNKVYETAETLFEYPIESDISEFLRNLGIDYSIELQKLNPYEGDKINYSVCN